MEPARFASAGARNVCAVSAVEPTGIHFLKLFSGLLLFQLSCLT
jgi:hypothetical protein